MTLFKDVRPRFLLGVLDGGVSSLERRVLRLIDMRPLWPRRYRVLSILGCCMSLSAVCAGGMLLCIQPKEAIASIKYPTLLGTQFSTPSTESAITQAPVLSFEVASIKPTDPNSTGDELWCNGSVFETKGQTLKQIVKFAYGLNFSAEDQVAGPKWVTSTKFDIHTKGDEETNAALKKMSSEQQFSECRLMVQELLADRFKLKTHHETKDLPVYALSVAKGGTKPALKDTSIAGGTNSKHWTGVRSTKPGELEGRDVTIALVTNAIPSLPEIGRMVLDKTGLTGTYSFTLKWAPDISQATTFSGADGGGPSLFTAMKEQLGLELDATKGPVDVVVIDHVERPTEN